jgi:hypothetical protein
MGDKALVVGINAYPKSPLRGCVNDAMDMGEVLVSRYRFKYNQIRLLCDGRATTEAIKQRLYWLTDAGPKDRIFFHFSGHGVQVTSRDKYNEEIDGLDEVICPVDFDWSAKHMITDDWLYNHFKKKVKKGTRFYWVADCCHSGTLTRDLSDVIQVPRMYPTPPDLEWRKRSLSLLSLTAKFRDLIRGGDLDVGFISGCRAEQTSADTEVGGRPCGALTHFLIRNMRKMRLRTSLKDLVKKTQKDLSSSGYWQVPQAEGTRVDKPFLA